MRTGLYYVVQRLSVCAAHFLASHAKNVHATPRSTFSLARAAFAIRAERVPGQLSHTAYYPRMVARGGGVTRSSHRLFVLWEYGHRVSGV